MTDYFTILTLSAAEGYRLLRGPLRTVGDVSRTYLAYGEEAGTQQIGAVFNPSGHRTHIVDLEGKVWYVRDWPTASNFRALARAVNALGMCQHDPKK